MKNWRRPPIFGTDLYQLLREHPGRQDCGKLWGLRALEFGLTFHLNILQKKLRFLKNKKKPLQSAPSTSTDSELLGLALEAG